MEEAAAARGTEPTPAPHRFTSLQKVGVLFGIVVGVIAVLAVFAKVVIAFNNLERSQERITTELAGIKSAVNNGARNTNQFRTDIFDLITQLHPDRLKFIRGYRRDRNRPAPTEGQLALPLGDQPAYAHDSTRAEGMLAFTVPSAQNGSSIPVFAMQAGTVSSVRKDSDGFGAVEVSLNSGLKHLYEHLKTVDVAVGTKVGQRQVLGSVVASSPICIRVGIIERGGNVLNPRPFLPLLEESVPEPPAPAGTKSQRN